MAYKIELKVQQSPEYWFVTMHNDGPGLTRRDRYATEFATVAEAKAMVEQLMAKEPKKMRKFLNKDSDFVTPVSFTAHGIKAGEIESTRVLQKLYTFIKQE